MRIGIVGNGVVGHATARCFMESCEVRVYDKDPKRSTHSLDRILGVTGSGRDYAQADLIFICLPETELESFFDSFPDDPQHEHWEDANLVIKSTCPIGTTRKLAEKYGLTGLVHSPEFLTARCAVADAQLPARNIIGVPFDGPLAERPTMVDGCEFTLHELYYDRFPGVPVHTMRSDESEAVKLMTNSFFAVKIAYFNEINALCEKLGLDWETVRAGILSDGRIAHSHTQVPGPDGQYGFDGACLPKDLEHLRSHIVREGLLQLMTDAATIRNASDRTRNKT